MHETLSFFSGLILGSLLTLLLKPILLRASRRRAGRSELDTPLLPVASPAENATSAVASGTPAAYRPPKTALPTRSVVAAGGTLADETAETDQLLETVEGGGSLENAISVTVDNCSDQLATLVRVVVSDRTGLLAEMSAVLSGLGLSVLSATVSTDEAPPLPSPPLPSRPPPSPSPTAATNPRRRRRPALPPTPSSSWSTAARSSAGRGSRRSSNGCTTGPGPAG